MQRRSQRAIKKNAKCPREAHRARDDREISNREATAASLQPVVANLRAEAQRSCFLDGGEAAADTSANAASEDRTHDLRIMRPMRYQLRYCRGYQSLRAGLLQKDRRSGAQPTFARCHQGPRRLAVELTGRCACQRHGAVAASDCGSGECTKGTPHV